VKEKREERWERVWEEVGFAGEASTKQGAYRSVEGQKEERGEREKQFFYWQRGRQCVLVKGIKKEEEEGGGASFALLALSGIKGLRHVESSVSESGEDKWERTTKRIMKRNVLRKEIGP